MTYLSRRILLFVVLLLSVTTAFGQIAPKTAEPLIASVKAPAGFVATSAPVALESIAGEVDSALVEQANAFRADAKSSQWKFYVDRRSGGMALVEGSGVAWMPGKGNSLSAARFRGTGKDGSFTLDDLASKARAVMVRYPRFFVAPQDQLILDPKASSNFGEDKQFWAIVFRQEIGGVPVAHSRVTFHVSHGNLVQFGIDHVVSPKATPSSPKLSAAQAKLALASHVGGMTASDKFLEEGTLLYVPRGTNDVVGYGGPVGQGWKAELVYRYQFTRAGQIGGWKSLVSADTGEVLQFVDDNDYASVLAKGSVYTITNCAAPPCDVTPLATQNPGNVAERGITMPFARLTFSGGTCTGDGCFTNSAGAFKYPAGAVSATTSLDGKYFRIVDGCGAITASAAAPNGIDLGTTTLGVGNFDCAPANRESPPNSGPVNGGPGDTHSARNTFYHLNLINQKARYYMPNNSWLKGTDVPSQLPTLTTVNSAPACNAFWQGGTGSLNFQRLTAALFCNNTGEMPGVFLHEFGHGLDSNDGTGTAPESATGEAMGDTFALLETQNSCIGIGFRLKDPTDPTWGHTAGYGTKSQLCTGVRDMDYTRYCHKTGETCTDPGALAAIDPDIVQGSNRGLTPNFTAAEAGTPAKWSTMLSNTPVVSDGKSNFYNCGGPETTGCAGPLDHGCHCESLIASQSNWDLAKRIIKNEFGGDIYATQGPKEVSGWQYMDRLWYLTRDIAVSGYSVTGPEPTGTTNGCTVSDWFSTYRFVDDDDGNLANGTPHASDIFGAFALHETACGLVNDASNQKNGCPAPIAAPVLTACEQKEPVQLSWTASPGATQYRILRNTLGFEFGYKPIAVVSGTQLYFEDSDVAPGVTYYYTVQPVGVSESCYGQASNAIAVTPLPCEPLAIAPPATVTATASADNQITVNWSAVAGAGAYKVRRKSGNCASTNPFESLTVATAPQTSFIDTIDLQGSFTYSYEVASSDTGCAACTSAPSTCVSVVAFGQCTLPPTFGGAVTIAAAPAGTCALELGWAAGAPVCGGLISYNIYRSTDPSFVPSAANLLVSGVTALTYTDTQIQGGVRYFYIVRAVDGFGNSDSNMIRRNEVAVGTLTPGTLTDDAGDTGDPFFQPSPTLNNQWARRDEDLGTNTSKYYATTASGQYGTNYCQGLESYTIFLGANPQLSFSSSYSMEQGWDGGYVEVATEAGGFSNWTKLTTVNYPGAMSGPLGDPACGGPGFADGQPVFTGSNAGTWSDHSASLNAYSGQNIRLRFLFSSDPATNDAGWFIDDVEVTNVQIPGDCDGVETVAIQLEEDPVDTAGSDGNQVYEVGEDATIATLWRNVSGGILSFSGTGSTPGGSVHTVSGSTTYGPLDDLETGRCTSCFGFNIPTGTARPAVHWDAPVTETLSTGEANTWFVHVGESFGDVAKTHIFYRFAEKLVHEGITVGCGPVGFCPDNPVTRAQMAVFLLRAKHGPTYFPPPASGTRFADVPQGSFAAAWIEQLAAEQITSGCGDGTNYCPDNPVTREQMAFFLLAARFGANYTPPPATGVFDDVPPSPTGFSRFIEDLWRRGITAGCNPSNYCPQGIATRGEMSVFLVTTFGIE